MDVEFVVVSGFAEFAYAQEALRYGALDYFLKPIDIDMADPLIEKLALHFSKKKSVRNNLILEALTSTDKSELSRLTPFLISLRKITFVWSSFTQIVRTRMIRI